MNVFPIQTIVGAFAQLITVTGAPHLMRAIIWAALIVSASEAAAQLEQIQVDFTHSLHA